jgi:hypothetical protein
LCGPSAPSAQMRAQRTVNKHVFGMSGRFVTLAPKFGTCSRQSGSSSSSSDRCDSDQNVRAACPTSRPLPTCTPACRQETGREERRGKHAHLPSRPTFPRQPQIIPVDLFGQNEIQRDISGILCNIVCRGKLFRTLNLQATFSKLNSRAIPHNSGGGPRLN